jgi:septal ring-binding cell division protein DamX
MLKLSRRNWNNVLIFAVLALMFVLYGIPQRLKQLSADEHRLVPADSQLLMVALGEQRLIQAGTVWRLQPAANKTVDAANLAMAWQHGVLTPVTPTENKSRIPVAQASVQLVGQSAPLIWLLYPDVDGRYLLQQAGQQQFYALSESEAQLLFLL